MNYHKERGLSDLKNEIWKDIDGYEDHYQISNLGRVKSKERLKSCKGDSYSRVKGIILKQSLDGRGYNHVRLSKDSKMKTITVHKLVAMAFLNHVPNRYNLVVDHINNSKLDNRLDNLQIITHRKNTSKDRKHGTSKFTGVYKNSKSGKWVSTIKINGVSKYLGSFDSELNASISYNNELNKIK